MKNLNNMKKHELYSSITKGKEIDPNNLGTEYEYYAVCIEDSYYVKKGAIERIPDEKTALKAKEEGKYEFVYSFNMHWDSDLLKCAVIKKEIKYSLL